MTTVAQDVSKISGRYRTTVPSGVLKQLNLNKGDHIRYCTESSGPPLRFRVEGAIYPVPTVDAPRVFGGPTDSGMIDHDTF